MRTFNKTIMMVLGSAAILALASQVTAQVRYSHSRGGYQRSHSGGHQRSHSGGFSFGVHIGSRPQYVQHHRPQYSHYSHRRPVFSHYRKPAPWNYSHRGHLYSRPGRGTNRGVFVVPSRGPSRSGYAVPGRSVSRGGYSSPSFGISWGGRSSSRHHRR